MLDHDLDHLLQRARGPEPTGPAVAAARDLAGDLRPSPRPTARRSRRLRLAAVGLGAAVLLSAGTTLAAYQLSIPPFQTLPEGLERLEHPIPLDFVETDGTRRRCLVFLEFTNVSRSDLERLDRAVAERTWTAAEQREVTGTAGAPAPRTEDEVLPDTARDHLYAFALTVVPTLSDELPDGTRPTFAGYGASCLDGLP